MTTHSSVPSAMPVPSVLGLEEAFEQTAAEREALDADDLVSVNFDVQSAAGVALGAVAKLAGLRSAIAHVAPTINLAKIDRIEAYALAAYQSHTLFKHAVADDEGLPALYEEALELRRVIHSDLRTLAKRGALNAATFARHKGFVGYRNVASDLYLYVDVARHAWPTIRGKTSITEAELDRGAHLSVTILRLSSKHAKAPAANAKAAQDRQRAATLLVRAYDEARRAVTFLRWNEGDADAFAPTLFEGRKRRPRRKHVRASEIAPRTTETPTSHAANEVTDETPLFPAVRPSRFTN